MSDLASAPAGARRVDEVVFWLLTFASVAPFWSGDLLALTDWPHHLVSAQVVLDFADPARRLAEGYRVALAPRPYLGPTYLLMGLASQVGLQAAGKLVLSGYAVALCAGVRSLLRAGGRDARLAWLAPLFVHQWALAYGFLPYVASLPPALFAVAQVRRLLDRASAARWAGLLALYVVCALMHPLGVLIAVVATCGLLLAARARPPLWAGVFGIWAAVGLWGLLSTAAVSRDGVVFMDLGIETAWRWTIKHRLVGFSLAYLPGNLDYIVGAAGLVALFGAALVGRREGRFDPLEGAGAAMALLYLVAPVNLAVFSLRMSLLSPRLVVPTLLFALPLARGRAPRLAALGAVAALAHAGLLAKTHHDFSARWSGAVEAALGAIEPGAKVVPDVARPSVSALNPSTVRPPEEALHAYSMQVAGFDGQLFSTPQGPLHILAGAATSSTTPTVRWVQREGTIRIEPDATPARGPALTP